MSETTKKIMVVDDEPIALRTLTFKLQKEGYEVTALNNPLEVLDKAKASPPDLMFLDVMMPGKDGFTLCREIKNEAATQGIYIIMLTALGQSYDQEKAEAAGANEFMTKPFHPSKMVERLQAIFADESLMVCRS